MQKERWWISSHGWWEHFIMRLHVPWDQSNPKPQNPKQVPHTCTTDHKPLKLDGQSDSFWWQNHHHTSLYQDGCTGGTLAFWRSMSPARNSDLHVYYLQVEVYRKQQCQGTAAWYSEGPNCSSQIVAVSLYPSDCCILTATVCILRLLQSVCSCSRSPSHRPVTSLNPRHPHKDYTAPGDAQWSKLFL